MWILKRKSDGRKLYLLSGEFTVGRKLSANVHIQAPEDVSVSRQHFKIKIVYSASGSITSEDSAFEIEDLGSTFGTYYSNPENGSVLLKLRKQESINLKEGSTLVFGKLNEWIITWNDISILLSAVGSAERKKLTENVSKIGSRVVSDWSEDVVYLVMEEVKFTQKVLDGLLAEKPIVTVKFFENWIKALEKNPESPLPDIAHHIPPLDSTLATQFDQKLFLPNTQRKTIFQGKTFIFSQPNPIYAAAVEKAGGNVKMDLNFDDVNQDVLLVEWSSQLPGNQQTSGKRVIPFKDISYAILECSTGRFYNSSYTSMGYAANKSSSSSQNFSQSHDVTISREESCFDKSEPPLKKKKVEHSQGAINLQPPNKKVCVESIRIENVEQDVIYQQRTSPEPKRKTSVHSHNRRKVVEASQGSIIEPTQPSTQAVKSRDHEKLDASKCNTSKWISGVHSDKLCKIATATRLVYSKPRLGKNYNTRQGIVIRRIEEMRIVDFKDGKWLI